MSRRHPRLVTTALVGLLAALTLGPSTTTMAVAQTATPTLTLVRQSAFVGPDGTFRAEVSTASSPADTRLSLTLHAPVGTRARLDRAMADEQLGTIILSTAPVTPAAGTTTTTLSLPVSSTWPAPTGGAVLPTAGVYPVTIDATRPDGSRLGRLVTTLVRLPTDDTATTPLSVGTVVTIDATPMVGTDGSTTLSAPDAVRTRDQLAIVGGAPVPPVALSASPFVLTTLRASGTPIGGITAGRSLLSEPWVSIDTASLIAGRQEAVVIDEHRVGDSALESSSGAEPDHRIAVVDGTTTGRGLDLAAATGTRAVVLGSARLRATAAVSDASVLTRQFVVLSENGTSLAAMAADDGAVVSFADGTDPVLAAHRALAAISMLHFEQAGTGHGLAVVLPSTIAPIALREFLAGLTDRDGASSGSTGAPVVVPVSLTDLFASTVTATDRTGPVVREWTADDPTELGEWTTMLDQARWDLRGLRTLLPEGADLVDPIERSVMTSAARWLSTPDRLAVLAGAERAIRGLAASISLPETQAVTLTSRSGDIPLTLENSLTTDARVRISASSPKLDFPAGATIDLVLPPGTTQTNIPVTTRASGAFPLTVTVSSADGVLPIATSRIDVRSTAISGWGLVLSVGAGLFLAVWWIRHFRHTRRARSLIDVGPTETGTTTPH